MQKTAHLDGEHAAINHVADPKPDSHHASTNGASPTSAEGAWDFAAEFEDVFEDRPDETWQRPRRWTKPLLALGVLVVIAGGTVWGLSAFSSGEVSTAGWETLTVTPKTFVMQVVESGQLESSANVHLRSEVSGVATITSIVADGTSVSAGDVVVEFDRSEFETKVSEQEVKVRQARSTVVEKQTEMELAEIALEEYVHGTFAKELKEAEVEIRVAEEELQRAQEYFRYSTKLANLGYVTEAQLQADQFAVEKTKLELEKATVKRDSLQNYTYRKEVKDKSGAIAKAKATLAESEEILTVETSRLEQLQASLDKCTIKAPQDGMVVYANDNYRSSMSEGGIGPGAQIWQTQTVIWLPDMTQMQVAVNVHESRIQDLHPGMKATVKVQDTEYEGEVISIANQPEMSYYWMGSSVKKYKTIVKILGRPKDLKPGLTAKVTIVTESVPDAVALPIVSVFSSKEGDRYCYVKNGADFELRRVECGSTNVEEIHVRQGISPGDVVLQNAGKLNTQANAAFSPGELASPTAGE